MTSPRTGSEDGYALLTVLFLMALISALIIAYFTVTAIDLSSTRSSLRGIQGFYAAEAGLNLRAETVRQIFEDYNVPAGTSPANGGGQVPCVGANVGTGDYACVTHPLQRRRTVTYVEETPGNPVAIVVPRGEPYQNLSAMEYRYVLGSTSLGADARTEAVLEMTVKERLVPLFQFLAFYNKDLEILPGPAMNLSGPVHSNGDLYLDTGASLDIRGQVTAADGIYRGRKDADQCGVADVRVLDPAVLQALPACTGQRALIPQTTLDAWNGMIRTGVEPLTVPPPEALDPTPGQLYWDRADLRVMLDLNAGTVQVRDAAGATDGLATAALNGCAGAAVRSNSMFNNREGTLIEMLDVDVERLLDCVHANALLGPGKDLADPSDGGLVVYLGVDGPNAAVQNNYGVRLRNGAELAATAVGAPAIRGLTVVTAQAAYVQGDYNAVAKKPAAVLADSLNVLSNNWNDFNSTLSLGNRQATDTRVFAAFLAGTDVTGGEEGAGGQDQGEYNGGLENYPRFHERWVGATLTYRGSFVSLNEPQHVDGAWSYGDPVYEAPARDWDYDTDFNDAANLPPLTPRFTYIRQELHRRRFEL
jgi:hypothetical protein